MLTREAVKVILLEELQAKGYAPNPGDVTEATRRIMELAEEEPVKELKGVKSKAPSPPKS